MLAQHVFCLYSLGFIYIYADVVTRLLHVFYNQYRQSVSFSSLSGWWWLVIVVIYVVYGQPVLCVSVMTHTNMIQTVRGQGHCFNVSLFTNYFSSQLPPFFYLQWSIAIMHLWPRNLSFTGDCLQAQGCLVHKKNGFKKVICYPFIAVMS